jgi:hypothetical protein
MMNLYKELTHSNLEGSIPYGNNIRNLYVIYCLDRIGNDSDFKIPEYAYGGFVKEIGRIADECSEHFIDGEDYSAISLYALSGAFLAYFLENNMKLSEIDRISSYEFAETVVRYLE